MTTDNLRSDGRNLDRPALSGSISPEYERSVFGGGSGATEFNSPERVKGVFHRGLDQLNRKLRTTDNVYPVNATMARVQLHPDAIAKSHRHPALFDTNRFQVAGVQQPGSILALVTDKSLTMLSDLVENASPNQMKQLSSVVEIAPFEPLVRSSDGRSVVALFDGLLDDGSRLRERGLEVFEQLGHVLRPYGKSETTFTANSLPLEAYLRDMPWLREVRPVGQMRLTSSVGAYSQYPTAISYTGNVSDLPIVGIIDSGIDTSVPGLGQLVVHQDGCIPDVFADRRHGTLVATMAATGGEFSQMTHCFSAPHARLLDIQVLGAPPCDYIEEDTLLMLIEDAVSRYGPKSLSRPHTVDEPVRIWNISIGQGQASSEDTFSTFATELDRIASENDVIFTVPSGNYETIPLRGWLSGSGPDEDLAGEDRVAPPGDAVLAVSVGALSDSDDPPTASPIGHPSPFSRRGPGPGMSIKPDVVQDGGTRGKYGEEVPAVRGPYLNGSIATDVGTSFAAPKVAAQLAESAYALSNTEPELLKLLMLLSCCSTIGDYDNKKRESIDYYGFGVPESSMGILACEPWECTVILSGELRQGHALHVPLPFPTCLEENGLRRGFIRAALVYTPVLDPSKGAEYCQTTVDASIGREIFDPKENKSKYKREVSPLPPSHGAHLEADLIKYGWKWSPTKVYERTIEQMRVPPTETGWRMSFNLLLRRELEDRREDVRQKFWFGIRITDPRRTALVYQQMRLHVQALAQPITLRARTNV